MRFGAPEPLARRLGPTHSMAGFTLLSRSYYYLRRRSPAPPFPPDLDHRQAGERGAIKPLPLINSLRALKYRVKSVNVSLIALTPHLSGGKKTKTSCCTSRKVWCWNHGSIRNENISTSQVGEYPGAHSQLSPALAHVRQLCGKDRRWRKEDWFLNPKGM